jgi:pimeloyl-ACP methyl ester carboxylesterase
MPALHHVLLSRPAERVERVSLLLHGILGSGPNLRMLGVRLLERAQPGLGVALVDLRMHGRSQGFSPPHSVAACAEDLAALCAAQGFHVDSVVGHSFGGKVALRYAAEATPRRLVMLDSAPFARPGGRGSEDTLSVLAMLEGLPDSFPRRDAFVDHVLSLGYSRALAEWLSMSLTREDGALRFGLSLPAIRALLDDYLAQDLWPMLTELSCDVDLVIAGRSSVWGEQERAEARTLASGAPSRVRVHALEQSGHWVHIDALDALVDVLSTL